MKVIFLDNVAGVASRGDAKNVKSGYFRNYLQPNRKAVPATDVLLKEWEEKRKKILIEKEQLKGKFEEAKRRVAGASLKLEKKVTQKGTLYGGVKATDIAKAIKEQFNLEVPEGSVVLPASIKSVGTYDVRLNFGEGVEAELKLEVAQKG